jgi:peptidoglycan biosynthesis protein MviN/MurJ (putative lipid II flippase)
MGTIRLFARVALIEAAVNLVLSLVLVRPFGLEGVAVAVAGPNVLFCLFAIGFACRTLSVSASRYLWQAWTRPLAAAAVPAIVWWFATPVEATWPGIAAGLASGLIPYAIAVGAIEWVAAIRQRAPERKIRVPLRCRWFANARQVHPASIRS